MSAELATLAADPERVSDVPVAAIPALIGEAEALRALLWARLQAPPASKAKSSTGGGPDRMLTAEEVAERLGVSKRWVYRQQESGHLPFAVRLSENTLRFSEQGLERWKARR